MAEALARSLLLPLQSLLFFFPSFLVYVVCGFVAWLLYLAKLVDFFKKFLDSVATLGIFLFVFFCL